MSEHDSPEWWLPSDEAIPARGVPVVTLCLGLRIEGEMVYRLSVGFDHKWGFAKVTEPLLRMPSGDLAAGAEPPKDRPEGQSSH